MAVDFFSQRFRLIRQQREQTHVFPENNIHFFINDQANSSRHGQQPVVCIVHFGDFAPLVNQQGDVVHAVFGNKIEV